jgi:hypothetical protein
MPAFSRAAWTSESVEVREPIRPEKDSMRRIVPMATRDLFANSTCSQPSNARAARSCRPVIKKGSYHASAANPKKRNVIINYLIIAIKL